MRRFAILAAVLGLSAVAVGSVGAATKTKTKSDKGTAFIGETRTTGSGSNTVHYEAGNISDKVLGAGAVTFNTKISVRNGVVHFRTNSLTFWTKNGSLSGTASADINATSPTTATVTNGKVNLTHGTGALKGHSLVGKFSGKGNPTTTEYSFQYTGTYK